MAIQPVGRSKFNHHDMYPEASPSQFGHDTERRPELVDDDELFEEYVGRLAISSTETCVIDH